MEFIESNEMVGDELVSFGKPSDRELLRSQWDNSQPTLASFGKDFFINGTILASKRDVILEVSLNIRHDKRIVTYHESRNRIFAKPLKMVHWRIMS